MRLLDPGFRYVPSANTNVAATWKRFGYRPTTDAERRARQAGNAAGRLSMAESADSGSRLERRRPLAAPADARVPRLRLAVSE
jgi:hypothetical protein